MSIDLESLGGTLLLHFPNGFFEYGDPLKDIIHFRPALGGRKHPVAQVFEHSNPIIDGKGQSIL